MSSWSLYLGIIPLFLFVIVDSFAGLKTAIVTAVIFSILEMGFSLYFFHEIDWLSILSFVLILGTSFLSYKTNSSLHFKFQPVILSVIFGVTMIVSFIMDKPILLEFALKYQAQLPGEMTSMLEYPEIRSLLRYATMNIGIALQFHAAVTALAALRLSNWWWIAVRGVGFYFFCFVGMFAAQLQVRFFS